MLKFRSLCAEDKKLFDRYRMLQPTMSSEGAFATLFIWNEYYNLKIAENGEYLFLRFEIKGDSPSYFFPIGKGDIRKAVDELEKYSHMHGEKLIFRLVEEKNAELLKEIFPEKFVYTYDRNCSDYMYDAPSLSSLSGKKLHAKRNHLNYFRENYDYSFEPVTADNISECKKMVLETVKNKTKNINPYELGAMEIYFKRYFELSQTGIMLKADGKTVAAAFGERLTEEAGLVQIEIADESVRGAYQMINKLFCDNAFEGIKYMNREEDMGIEGLRQAKESYKPVFLVNKYIACEKEN